MSPFEVVCAAGRPALADKTQLIEASRRIEARALTLPSSATLWVSLQHADYLTERTEWVYRTIASVGVTVHVHAPGLTELAGAPDTLHVHDTRVGADWAVLLLGGRVGWGMAARDRSRRHEPDDRRTFEWAVTRDPVCIATAAQALAVREPVLSSVCGPSPV